MRKNIIAIESWDGKNVFEPKLGMKPLLDFATILHGVKYSYNFFYTPEELRYLLRNIVVQKDSLLYLSLHGSPENIKLGMFSEFIINLDDLGEIMGRRFDGAAVHFGSCATLYSWQTTIQSFINKTGVRFVSGYTEYVDFSESSVVDLALINRWAYAKNYKKMFQRMEKSYKQMLLDNGFVYYFPQ